MIILSLYEGLLVGFSSTQILIKMYFQDKCKFQSNSDPFMYYVKLFQSLKSNDD